jgi:hypothetical protein
MIPAPANGLRRFFPIPLVGAAALLIVLILFTPILFGSGPAAPGTFETQALLIVDRPAASATTNFYVRAEGDTVRYASISFGSDAGFTWTGSCPTGLHWTYQNATDVVAANVSVAGSTVALNVTATYTVGASTAVYAAVVAFAVSGSTLAAVACYGATLPGSLPVASLPVALPLTDYGSGGPP